MYGDGGAVCPGGCLMSSDGGWHARGVEEETRFCLILVHQNIFANLKIFLNESIFGPMMMFVCMHQFKVDMGYISLNGDISASK